MSMTVSMGTPWTCPCVYIALIISITASLITCSERRLPYMHQDMLDNANDVTREDLVLPAKRTSGHRDIGGPGGNDDKSTCSFEVFPNTLAGGNEFRKIREGADLEECKRACINSESFYCAGVLLRDRSTCYLTGFQSRDNFWSRHYYRTCALGPGCFQAERGISMEGTSVVAIPKQYVWTDWTRALYCMAQCEMDSACTGFDILSHTDKRSKCYLAVLKVIPNINFNLHMRRC